LADAGRLINTWLLHHRPEAQANTKSSMMTNQIVVPVLAEALVIADSRAHVTAAQTDAMPMQRFAASSCRGPALTRPDLGRLHSSATGVAEPDPDASYVALAIVRCRAGARSKQSCAAAHTDARYWAKAQASRRGRQPDRDDRNVAQALASRPSLPR
jgi:hypothetical protein